MSSYLPIESLSVLIQSSHNGCDLGFDAVIQSGTLVQQHIREKPLCNSFEVSSLPRQSRIGQIWTL